MPAQQTSQKRGLGWPWDQPASHFSLYQAAVTAGKISWLFNWELWRPGGITTGIEWVPCIRTAGNAEQIDPFLTDIVMNQGVKVTSLLGFNEPEIPDQANLSVDEAVKLWRSTVLPAKKKFGLRLGSPGFCSDVGRCKPWFDDFLGKLRDDGGEDGVDFLVVHWYGPDFAGMKGFLEDMHSTYGLPVWINEFACSYLGQRQVGVKEVENFIQEAVPWLEQCEWIERYAYYGNGQGRDVGEWVGRGSNFTEQADECEGTDGRTLSKVARVYCEV